MTKPANAAIVRARVRAQLSKVERLARLKRFLSPSVVELLLSGEAEDALQTHRREVAAVFVDPRGFTAFADSSDPEEVIQVLAWQRARPFLVLGEGKPIGDAPPYFTLTA